MTYRMHHLAYQRGRQCCSGPSRLLSLEKITGMA
jgi:hypothetical protein